MLGLYFANEGMEDVTSVPALVGRVCRAAQDTQGRTLSVFAVSAQNNRMQVAGTDVIFFLLVAG